MIPKFHQHFLVIWKYRDYIHSQASAARASSISGYLFGNAWFLLTPLLEMLVYYLLVVVIFQRPAFGNVHPFVGLMIGLVHFWVFSRIVQRSIASVVARRGLMMQVKIEPIVFVATDYINELTKSFYYLPLLCSVLLYFSYLPNNNVVWYPLIMVVILIAAWSSALLLACIYVYFRDIRNGAQVILRILLYVCPVIYPITFVPDEMIRYYLWNPFAVLYGVLQFSLLGAPIPPSVNIWGAGLFFLSLFFVAHIVYEKTNARYTKVM